MAHRLLDYILLPLPETLYSSGPDTATTARTPPNNAYNKTDSIVSRTGLRTI